MDIPSSLTEHRTTSHHIARLLRNGPYHLVNWPMGYLMDCRCSYSLDNPIQSVGTQNCTSAGI